MIRALRPLALSAALIALAAAPSWAQEVDVSGKWEFTTEGPRGTRTQVFTFQQDGATVTGSTEMMMGRRGDGETATVEISNGKIEGGVLTFTIERSFGGNSFVINYTATVDGDCMDGKTVNPRGESTFTAARVEG